MSVCQRRPEAHARPPGRPDGGRAHEHTHTHTLTHVPGRVRRAVPAYAVALRREAVVQVDGPLIDVVTGHLQPRLGILREVAAGEALEGCRRPDTKGALQPTQRRAADGDVKAAAAGGGPGRLRQAGGREHPIVKERGIVRGVRIDRAVGLHPGGLACGEGVSEGGDAEAHNLERHRFG